MAETITALSEQLYSLLQQEAFVILTTVDAESGSLTANAISWVYAADTKRLRFAVDGRSRIIANVKANPHVSVAVFAAETLYAITGLARVVVDGLDGVPFKLAAIDIDIQEVRDAMYYGSRISVRPETEKTYDQRAADKLDGQVFDALKKA